MNQYQPAPLEQVIDLLAKILARLDKIDERQAMEDQRDWDLGH